MNQPYERETENTLKIIGGAIEQVHGEGNKSVDVTLSIELDGQEFIIPIPMGVLRPIVNLGVRHNIPVVRCPCLKCYGVINRVD